MGLGDTTQGYAPLSQQLEGRVCSQMAKKPRHMCQGINCFVASGHALGVVSATWAAENTIFSSDTLLGSTMSFSSRPLSSLCLGVFFYFLTAFRGCYPKPLLLSEIKSIIISLLSVKKTPLMQIVVSEGVLTSYVCVFLIYVHKAHFLSRSPHLTSLAITLA